MKKRQYFFNTTALKGDELQDAIKNAIGQELRAEYIFRLHSDKELTRSEVYNKLIQLKLISKKTPEPSFSRALSNLKKWGVLEITKNLKKGNCGKSMHTYKLLKIKDEQAIK